jgi:hypothetical protein
VELSLSDFDYIYVAPYLAGSINFLIVVGPKKWLAPTIYTASSDPYSRTSLAVYTFLLIVCILCDLQIIHFFLAMHARYLANDTDSVQRRRHTVMLSPSYLEKKIDQIK